MAGLPTVLVVLAGLSGWFDGLESQARDVAFRLRGSQRPHAPIVIVAVDDESFAQTGLQWPWPRGYLAEIVRRIAEGRPSVIGLDILFHEPGRDAGGDQALAAALRGAGGVVLASSLSVVRDPQFAVEQLSLPVPSLRQDGVAVGLTNVPRDARGAVQSVVLTHPYQDGWVYGWSLRVAQRHLGSEWVHASGPTVQLGERTVPTEGGRMLVNYRGPPRTFATLPAYQVAGGEIDPTLFEGRIVLVGATSESLHDTYPNPFGGATRPMSGVEIQANAIDTLLAGDFLRRGPTLLHTPWATLVLVAISGAAAAWSALHLPPPRGALAAMLLASVLAGLWVYLFIWQGFVIGIAPLGLTLTAVYGVLTVDRLVHEERERRRVRHIFERYVSPEAVKEILSLPAERPLRGRRLELTVLFADIRGFTSLSERLEAEQVVALLNRYLDTMTEAIFEAGGTVNRFMGDGLLAFFGAPIAQQDHAARAVRAALAMHARLAQLQEAWHGATGQELEIGIGLHTGPAMVGSIGSSRHMEYTVIGDTANVAARLQELTKSREARIIMSEATRARAAGVAETRSLGDVRLRGRAAALQIHALQGLSVGAAMGPGAEPSPSPVPLEGGRA